MKKLRSIIFITTLVCVNSAYSGTGEVSGNVLKIRSHDSSLGTDSDWVQLDNVSAGTCKLYQGKIIFKIKDNDRGKRHLAMVMAARLASKPVVIAYDDIGLSSGYCSVRYVDL